MVTAAPGSRVAQGEWPRAIGLLGAAAIHAGLAGAVLAWREPPRDAPPPIAVELVVETPAPMPELPVLEPPPLPAFETTAPAGPTWEAAAPAEPEPPPAPTASAHPSPRSKPKRTPKSLAPPAAGPSAPAIGPAAPSVGPTVAPTPAPASPPATVPPVEDAAYLATLLRHLEQHREYPRSARLRRIEGRAVVQLALARDGRVLEARIERSAGHEALDAAAIDTVRRAAPLPRVPAELPGERVILRVPFIYRLNASAASE